jgi:PAS domain S-box-containing protein
MSSSTPRRQVVTVWAKAAIGLGVLIFAFSFVQNMALQNHLAGDLLELLGTAALVGGANLIVLRLTQRTYITGSFIAGSAFLILARFLDFTEEIPALSGVPFLGGAGFGQEFLERGSESFGYICLLVTMLFVMYELARLNESTQAEKQEFKTLFESSQYLARLVDLSTDGVFAVNSQGIIQAWNAGAQRYFQYSADEAKKRTFRDLLVSGLDAVGDDLVHYVEQKGPQQELEVVAQREDGSRFVAAASFSPVAGAQGKSVGACIIVRSIEERKRAEQELLASRNLLSRALQAADVGLFIVDRKGELLEFNSKMKHIAGLEDEELDHLTLATALPKILLNSQSVLSAIEERVLEQGKHAEFRNIVIHRLDGETRICNGAVAPVTDEAGVVVAAAGVVVDVTEREALHAKLLEVQKMDSIGRLAGGIAHDFNNIMAGVLGYSTLVRQELGQDSPHYRRMTAIEDSALRAAELTNQLLTFAQAGARNIETLSLNAIVGETVNLLSHTLDPNVRLSFDATPNLDHVEADRTQIHQIVMNLCLNSRDAMTDGAGEIRISTANVDVDDALAELAHLPSQGSFVRLTVEDSGCGMPPEVARRMFDPFFSTKQQGQAIGMGLSVVYGIIQSHGGGLRVESEKGKGTRIDVYLPSTTRGTQVETSPLKAPPSERKSDATILVVDDEKLLRTLLQDILGMAGYNVVEATTGEEAIEIYQKRHDEIALIVLDIVMPGMGGAKALELLTQINPDVRCIVSSGYGSEALDASLLNHENIRFLAKPFQSTVVVDTVREMLAE